MGDLITLLKNSNSKKWYGSVSKELPILLISGEDDPVGNFGKGVKEVADKLTNAGANIKTQLYKGARHEILNDFTYENAKKDILDFCK